MASFDLFSCLPVELQYEIWESAVENESNDRIVPLDDTQQRVLPNASLVSPLLSACTLSRKVALAHYNTPLDMFSVPRTAFANYYTTIVERTAAGERYPDPKREDDETPICQRRGRLYLNLSRDNFFLIEDTRYKKGLKIRGIYDPIKGSLKAPLLHRSWALSEEQCRQIKKIYIMEYRKDEELPVRDYGDYKVPPGEVFLPENFSGTEQGCIHIIKSGNGTPEEVFLDLATLTSTEYAMKYSTKYITFKFDHSLGETKWIDPYKIINPFSE
ncbi:hypothetical protein F5B20DRAFT_593617 [Whalleya microplaca]|nr:hypothetical protein F5B20DRAFT_593617 [Whalleya microplaca]